MEPQHKHILRKNRLELSSNISTDDTILQCLYQEDILTLNHVEEIQAQPSNRKRTLMLLDILPTRGPKAFEAFLESLQVEYPWVRKKLLQGLDDCAVHRPARDDWAVPDLVLQSVPSEQQLNRLAGLLGQEWESVLMDLGLSFQDVYRCRADHLGVQSQVLAGLVLWKQRSGRKATIHRLIQSLQAAELHPSLLDQVFH